MFGLKRKPERKCTCGLKVKGDPSPITEAIYDDWMQAATEREEPIFEDIERILKAHEKKQFVKIWTMRRDIAWLRREAALLGLAWGKA